MSNFLMREMAPLGADLWAKIDELVVTVAKRTLVARKFVELVGPLGWGVEQAPKFGFAEEGGIHVATGPEYLPLQEIKQEFVLRAKQLAIAEQTPFGLDLGAAAIAAMDVARVEDELIIGGLAKQGKMDDALGDWAVPGGPFKAIASATAKLLSAGFAGPYAIVLSPEMYARLAGIIQNGVRELEMIEKLAKGGLFQYNGKAVAAQVLVLSLGAWNFDLVVGQDIATAYLGNEGLDQKLRIFETLALRVKLPKSICVLK
jgi:uncharacterized linocin/CFP29 family protein